MRVRPLNLVTVVALAMGLAVGASCVGGRNWVARTTAFRRDYRSPGPGPTEALYDFGTRSSGLFWRGGRFGWMTRTDTADAVEPDEDVGANAPWPPPRWAWRHGAQSGGVSDEFLDDAILDQPDSTVWRVPLLVSRAEFSDGGMRHSTSETAFVLDARGVLLLLGGAALPGLAAAVRRRSRRHQGRCACGYDLRASPGRCPECGATASR